MAFLDILKAPKKFLPDKKYKIQIKLKKNDFVQNYSITDPKKSISIMGYLTKTGTKKKCSECDNWSK